ncbi:HEAT repeat domain-containing protein [Promethearchaeum syntrophicum]|uniref:HEAT repeat domain-containing protein n=1 Tax=Promethearchaeum syntrophicum TaxID=2594042 RepID=A0A5B9DCU4_9ARCH|nr:HEAT repeat domain-containing protein [Candidatus Prometheoarchaeum syntrophicum]
MKDITENSQNIVKFKKIDLVIEKLLEEILDKTYQYTDQILNYLISHLNSNLIPYFLNQLTMISVPSKSGHKIAMYLIKAESRPIYQIKGLQLVSSLKNSIFTPFIINLIFSSHKPLQQQAIRTLLKTPGNREEILEQYLQDRSPQRKELAARLMKEINPDNVKLAQIMINSEDFLERIEGIKIISETGNRKWIKKTFQKMLENEKDLAVRKAIFEGITSLGGKKAEKILEISLENEDFTPMRNLIYNSIQILKNK